MPTPLLWRASMRHLLRHPWQFGLTVLGIALGVAVVVAIDLTNASAERAFDLSTEVLVGAASHHVVGGPSGVPESVYLDLRVGLGLRDSAPVVEGWALVPGSAGRTLRLVGVDPFAAGRVHPRLGRAVTGDTLDRFLTAPGSGLLLAPTAHELGVTVGDRLELRIDGAPHTIELCGLIEPADDRDRQALADVLLVDIATAQELLGTIGRLGRIDLILDESATALVDRVRRRLPAGVELETAARRSGDLYQMTRAFRLNLRALSLLALVVGMFLVYNTMTFSVVQRRTLLGRLRAVGTTRRQIFVLILTEALAIGLLGTTLGLFLGGVLASGLIRLVTQTINDLYFVLRVRELTLAPASLLKGLTLGTVAAMAAALAPALEATGAPPRAVMARIVAETRAHRTAPRLAAAGLALAALGAVALAVFHSIPASFVALFAILTGCAMLAPYLSMVAARAVRHPLATLAGAIGKLAAGGVEQSLSRTGVAIAALMIAVSVTVGVGVMIDSFRRTVVRWLEVTLQADVYVSPAILLHAHTDSELDPALIERIASTPGIAEISTIRTTRVRWAAGELALAVLDPAPHTRAAFAFQSGDAASAWRRLGHDDVALITEPLAYRHRLALGDMLVVQADDGPLHLEIVGVVHDYGSDQGAALVHRATYRRHYSDDAVTGIALVAAPGTTAGALAAMVRDRVGDRDAVVVRANRDLRQLSLAIFDRTFTITAVLRLLATAVAFIGVLASLMALALERGHEIAVLRANGLTPRQLFGVVLGQTTLMGLIAGTLSCVVGLILALVMVFVINRRSFGWTLDLHVDPSLLGQAVAIAVAAAVLAALYPARRMAATPPATALREE